MLVSEPEQKARLGLVSSSTLSGTQSADALRSSPSSGTMDGVLDISERCEALESEGFLLREKLAEIEVAGRTQRMALEEDNARLASEVANLQAQIESIAGQTGQKHARFWADFEASAKCPTTADWPRGKLTDTAREAPLVPLTLEPMPTLEPTPTQARTLATDVCGQLSEELLPLAPRPSPTKANPKQTSAMLEQMLKELEEKVGQLAEVSHVESPISWTSTPQDKQMTAIEELKTLSNSITKSPTESPSAVLAAAFPSVLTSVERSSGALPEQAVATTTGRVYESRLPENLALQEDRHIVEFEMFHSAPILQSEVRTNFEGVDTAVAAMQGKAQQWQVAMDTAEANTRPGNTFRLEIDRVEGPEKVKLTPRIDPIPLAGATFTVGQGVEALRPTCQRRDANVVGDLSSSTPSRQSGVEIVRPRIQQSKLVKPLRPQAATSYVLGQRVEVLRSSGDWELAEVIGDTTQVFESKPAGYLQLKYDSGLGRKVVHETRIAEFLRPVQDEHRKQLSELEVLAARLKGSDAPMMPTANGQAVSSAWRQIGSSPIGSEAPAARLEEVSPYAIGDTVEMRDNDEGIFFDGVVVSLDPLRIRFASEPEGHEGHLWNHVRSTKAEHVEARTTTAGVHYSAMQNRHLEVEKIKEVIIDKLPVRIRPSPVSVPVSSHSDAPPKADAPGNEFSDDRGLVIAASDATRAPLASSASLTIDEYIADTNANDSVTRPTTDIDTRCNADTYEGLAQRKSSEDSRSTASDPQPRFSTQRCFPLITSPTAVSDPRGSSLGEPPRWLCPEGGTLGSQVSRNNHTPQNGTTSSGNKVALAAFNSVQPPSSDSQRSASTAPAWTGMERSAHERVVDRTSRTAELGMMPSTPSTPKRMISMEYPLPLSRDSLKSRISMPSVIVPFTPGFSQASTPAGSHRSMPSSTLSLQLPVTSAMASQPRIKLHPLSGPPPTSTGLASQTGVCVGQPRQAPQPLSSQQLSCRVVSSSTVSTRVVSETAYPPLTGPPRSACTTPTPAFRSTSAVQQPVAIQQPVSTTPAYAFNCSSFGVANGAQRSASSRPPSCPPTARSIGEVQGGSFTLPVGSLTLPVGSLPGGSLTLPSRSLSRSSSYRGPGTPRQPGMVMPQTSSLVAVNMPVQRTPTAVQRGSVLPSEPLRPSPVETELPASAPCNEAHEVAPPPMERASSKRRRESRCEDDHVDFGMS